MATHEIVVKLGTKISEEEAKKLDGSKMTVAITGTPRAAEVEGQDPYWGYVQCPWCGQIGRALLNTNFYVWCRCGACFGAFRA